MSSRSRAPLASIPNGTNSPHRSLTQSIGKRSRQQGPALQENEPPNKKQVLHNGTHENGPSTPRRRIASAVAGRVFEHDLNTTQPNEFHKRLIASKKEAEKARTTATDNSNSIRAWQKHYRNAFPTFVFYFDNVPDDVLMRFSKQINGLGSRIEKFFSKDVTHIVTTRNIPAGSPTSKTSQPSSAVEGVANGQPQTINPSLLDKNSTVQTPQFPTRAQAGTSTQRDVVPAMDILSRGRSMGMKIWALEKLQRVLASILDPEGGQGQCFRTATSMGVTTRARDEDLSQVLRKDRLNGTRERDHSTSLREQTTFKGPFIYIQDMDVKTRPIMVREYAKPFKPSEGTWPQFRSSGVGKCPFIVEPVFKTDLERKPERGQVATRQAKAVSASTSRNSKPIQEVQMNPPRRSPRKALQEIRNVPAPPSAFKDAVPTASTFLPPKTLPQFAFPAGKSEFAKPQNVHHVWEPAASGIQQSNLTSAVRSQVISSTAAAPGVRAGTSKEVNELKRKVLERSNSGGPPHGSIPSSHRMTDIAGALKTARAPPPQRVAKARAQEKIGGTTEDNDARREKEPVGKTSNAAKKVKEVRKDLKPGFCEGCYEKYDDFEDHVTNYKKHRKYALDPKNWVELDRLLIKLV